MLKADCLAMPSMGAALGESVVGRVNRSNMTGGITDGTDPADDAIWILTSTFIIFTMQSGEFSDHLLDIPFQL